MLRAGRFRHRLLTDNFLLQRSLQVHRSLSPFIQLWRNQQVTECEMAAIYLLIFSLYRRPHDFLGGPHSQWGASEALRSGISCQQVLTILSPTLPPDLQNQKSLRHFAQETPLLNFLCQRSLRSLPLAVPRSLWKWSQHYYRLHLTTDIPDPKEVLEMQARGARCVSMLIEPQQLGGLTEDGRDAFGFLVHDLIHADHFFMDPEKTRGQILFIQKVRELLDQRFFLECLEQDEQLQAEFRYLISDMNSVPLHLLKTFKAQLLAHCKRQLAIPNQSELPKEGETFFQNLFLKALSPWQFSAAAQAAAQRLNTPAFVHPDDSYILHQEMTSP